MSAYLSYSYWWNPSRINRVFDLPKVEPLKVRPFENGQTKKCGLSPSPIFKISTTRIQFYTKEAIYKFSTPKSRIKKHLFCLYIKRSFKRLECKNLIFSGMIIVQRKLESSLTFAMITSVTIFTNLIEASIVITAFIYI